MKELPAGWQRRTLGEIAKVNYGKALRATDRVESGTVPVVGSAGRVGMHDESLIDGPAIIIGRKGNAGATFLETGPSWPIDTTYYLFPPDEVDPQYLALQLDHLSLSQHDSSTAVPSLRRPDLEGSVLSLPPLDEQQRVVRTAQDLLSRLEAAKRNCELGVGRLLQLRAATTHAAFHGLGPVQVLGEVATVISGQTPKGLPAEGRTGDIPFYKVGDMNSTSVEMAAARTYLSAADVHRLRLHVRPAGTVIFPKRGGAIATNKKRVLARPATFDLNTMGVVPGPNLSPHFLLRWFDMVDLGSLADGSNVPQINHGDITPLPIPVPDLPQQVEIVRSLDAQVDLIQRLISNLTKATTVSEALRSSILAAAFSGRLASQEVHNV